MRVFVAGAFLMHAFHSENGGEAFAFALLSLVLLAWRLLED